MADDTQPRRGLVLLHEWHVGLLVEGSMPPDEAEQLRAQLEQSLLAWRDEVSAPFAASLYVDVDD